MKTVLKISLFVLFFASAFTVNAQKYAIEGGYVNTVRYGSSVSSTYFNGGQLGVTANFDLKNNFSLLTGALYSFVYSDKMQRYTSQDSVSYKTMGHFLNIPLRIRYSLPINKNLKVFGYAGPNINIGLSQTQKIASTYSGITSGNYDLYKDALLSRLNFQLGAGGGVQWKKYQLKSGYDWGVNNLNKKNTGNVLQKGWYVSFAYEF
jgi:hypothetical protein